MKIIKILSYNKFFPQLQKLSVKALTLISFRDTVLLKTDIAGTSIYSIIYNMSIRFLTYFTLKYLTIPTIPTLPYYKIL